MNKHRPMGPPRIPGRRSKYKAKPVVYGGVRYASKAEGARAVHLDMLVRTGKIGWWIGQPKFRLGCPENIYVADFLVVGTDGRVLRVEDVKGMETQKFKRDRRLWKRYGPCRLWVVKPLASSWSADQVVPVGEDT